MARTALNITASTVAQPFVQCYQATPDPMRNCPELLNPYTGVPYLEANSQSFKAGDFVYLNAGAVTAITDDGTGTEVVAGMALTNGSNVTTGNTQIRIMPIYPGVEYIMSLYAASAASTNPDDAAKLVGKVLNVIAMTVTQPDASTMYCAAVNADAQTQARVVVTGVDMDPDNLRDVTNTYTRVKVKFPPYRYTSGTATAFNINTQLEG